VVQGLNKSSGGSSVADLIRRSYLIQVVILQGGLVGGGVYVEKGSSGRRGARV
jgi:hypothetical protein